MEEWPRLVEKWVSEIYSFQVINMERIIQTINLGKDVGAGLFQDNGVVHSLQPTHCRSEEATESGSGILKCGQQLPLSPKGMMISRAF